MTIVTESIALDQNSNPVIMAPSAPSLAALDLTTFAQT
jgi:hypothetical protein